MLEHIFTIFWDGGGGCITNQYADVLLIIISNNESLVKNWVFEEGGKMIFFPQYFLSVIAMIINVLQS